MVQVLKSTFFAIQCKNKLRMVETLHYEQLVGATTSSLYSHTKIKCPYPNQFSTCSKPVAGTSVTMSKNVAINSSFMDGMLHPQNPTRMQRNRISTQHFTKAQVQKMFTLTDQPKKLNQREKV